MSKKMYQITLSSSERRELERIITTGKHSARVINRARILLLTDEQETDAAIAEIVRISPATVFRIRKRYCQEGFIKAVEERSRSGAPAKLSGRVEAQLTAIACTEPPEGRVRWTTRLLADKLVKLELVESISHQAVGLYLKKTNSSPG